MNEERIWDWQSDGTAFPTDPMGRIQLQVLAVVKNTALNLIVFIQTVNPRSCYVIRTTQSGFVIAF